jgi:hypothetical protein
MMTNQADPNGCREKPSQAEDVANAKSRAHRQQLRDVVVDALTRILPRFLILHKRDRVP